MSGNPLEHPNPLGGGGGPPPPPPPPPGLEDATATLLSKPKPIVTPPPMSAPMRTANTSRHPTTTFSHPLPTPSAAAAAAVPPPESILHFGNPLQSSNAFPSFLPTSPPPTSSSSRPPVPQGRTLGGGGGGLTSTNSLFPSSTTFLGRGVSHLQKGEGSTNGSEGVGGGKSSVLQPLRMGHLDGRKSRPSHISLPSTASEDHDDGGSGQQHHSLAVEKAARSAAASRRGTLSLHSSLPSHAPPSLRAHRQSQHRPSRTALPDNPPSIDSAFNEWSSDEDGDMAGTFRPQWDGLSSPSSLKEDPPPPLTAAKGRDGNGGGGELGAEGMGRKAMPTTFASSSKFFRNGSPMAGSRTSQHSGSSSSSSSEASSESSYGGARSNLTVEYQRKKEASGSPHSSANPSREKNPFSGIGAGESDRNAIGGGGGDPLRGGGGRGGGSPFHGTRSGDGEDGERGAGNSFAISQGKPKGLGGIFSQNVGGSGTLHMGRARRYSDPYGDGDMLKKRNESGEERVGGNGATTSELLSSLDGTTSGDRMALARRRALSLFPTASTSEKYRGREGAAHPELVLHAEEGWKAHSYTKVVQKGYIVLIEWKVCFMIILVLCAALVLTGLFSGIISYVRNRNVLQVEQLAMDGAIAMIDAIRACSNASLTAPGTPVAEPKVVEKLRSLIRKVNWERKTLEDLLDVAKSALEIQDCFTAADKYNQVFGMGYDKSTDMISSLPMHLTSYSRAWALGWTQWRSQGLLVGTEDPPITSKRAITAVSSNVMCLSPLQSVSLATLLHNEYECTADYETILTATPVSSVNYPLVVNTMLDYVGELSALKSVPNSEAQDLFHILSFAILFFSIVLSMVYLSRVPFSYREAEKEKAIVHKDFVVHTSHVEMQRATLRLLDYYIWRLGAFEPISLKEAWCMGYEMSEADWERRVKELAAAAAGIRRGSAVGCPGRSPSKNAAAVGSNGKAEEEGEEGGGEGRNEDGASLASSPATGGGSERGGKKKTKNGNEEVGLPRPIPTAASLSKEEEEGRESPPYASASPFATVLRRRSTENGGDEKNNPHYHHHHHHHNHSTSLSSRDHAETKVDLDDSFRMGRLQAEKDDLYTFQGTTLKRQALDRSACLARLVDNATSSLLDEESAQIQVILHKVASTLLLLRPFIPRHLLHEVFPSEWASMRNLGPSLPFRRSHITLQEGLRSDVSVYLFISFYPFHRAEAVESARRFHVTKNAIEKQRFLREETKRQEGKNCLFREKNLERLYQTRYRRRRQLLTDMAEEEAIQGQKERELRGIQSRRSSRTGKEEARPEDQLWESTRSGDEGEDSESERDGSGGEEYASQQATSTGGSSGGSSNSSGAKKGSTGMDTVRVLSSRDIEGGAMRRRRGGGGGHSRWWGRRGFKKRKAGQKNTGGHYYDESRALLAGGGGGRPSPPQQQQQRHEENATSIAHRPSHLMIEEDGESDEEEEEGEEEEEEWTVGGRLIDTQYVVKTVLDRKWTLRAWRERQVRDAQKKQHHITKGPYRALRAEGGEEAVRNVLTPAGNERPHHESGAPPSHPLLPQDNFHPSGPDHAAAAAEGLRYLTGNGGGGSSPQGRRFGGRPLTNGRGGAAAADAPLPHHSAEGGTPPLLLHPSKTSKKGHHHHPLGATSADAITVVPATASQAGGGLTLQPPSMELDTEDGPPENPGLRSKYVTEYPLSNMAAGINYVVESIFRVASVFYGDVVQICGDGVLVKFSVEEEEEYANILGAKHTREDNTNLHPKKTRRRRRSSSKGVGAGDSDGGKDRRGRRHSSRGRRKSSSVSMSTTSLSATDTFFGGTTESPHRRREGSFAAGGGGNNASFLVPAEDGGSSTAYLGNSHSPHASPPGRHRSIDRSFVGGEWARAETRGSVHAGVREVTVRGQRYELSPAERAVRSAKVLQEVLTRYLDHSEDMFIAPEYLQCPMAIVSENYSLKGRLRYHVSKHYAVLSRCIPLFFALERINIEYGADIVMTEAIKNQVEGFVLSRPIHYLQVSDLNYHYMKETKTNHGLSRQSSMEPSTSGNHSPSTSGGRRGSASEDSSLHGSSNDHHRSSPSGSTVHVLLEGDALLPTKDSHGQGKGGGGEGKASGKEGRGEQAKREGVSPEDYPRFSAQGTVHALFHVAPLSEEDEYARVYAMEESHNQLRREHWRLIWEKYTAIIDLEPQIHFLRKFVHSLADSNGQGGCGGGGGGAVEGEEELGRSYMQSPFSEDGGAMSSPANRSVDRPLKGGDRLGGTVRPSGGGGGGASAAATAYFGSASFTPERASLLSSRFPGSGRGGAEEGGKKRDLTATSTGSMVMDAGSASSGAPGSTGYDGYTGSLRMDMRESSIATSIRSMRERLHDMMRELATYNNIYEYSSREGYSCQKLCKYGHDMLILLGETEEDIDREYGKS